MSRQRRWYGPRPARPGGPWPLPPARPCPRASDVSTQRWSTVRRSGGQLFGDHTLGLKAKKVNFSAIKWSTFRLTKTALVLVEPELLELGENRVEHARLSIIGEQALAKLGEYRVVEAFVLGWQVQRKFPVETEAQAVDGHAVGEVFQGFEDR